MARRTLSRRAVLGGLALLAMARRSSATTAPRLDAAPFALELEVLAAEPPDGPKLRAMVKNVAKSGKRILVDYQIQPVELLLTGPGGKRLEPFDERSRKKFDTTRHPWLFRVIGPSATYVAREDAFRKEDGGWELRFGNFTFSGLRAGTYRASLRFTSAGKDWRDGDGKSGTYDDLWEGTIESPEVEVRLP